MENKMINVWRRMRKYLDLKYIECKEAMCCTKERTIRLAYKKRCSNLSKASDKITQLIEDNTCCG